MCRVKHRRGVEELSAAESSQGRRNLGGRFAASSWSAPSICVSAGCPNQRRPGPSVTPTANRLGLSLKLGNAAVGDTTPPAPGIRLSVYTPLISSLRPLREKTGGSEESVDGENEDRARRGEHEGRWGELSSLHGHHHWALFTAGEQMKWNQMRNGERVETVSDRERRGVVGRRRRRRLNLLPSLSSL